MPKIFIIANEFGPDWLGMALAEDGTGLASHLSSSKIYVKHDMGLTLASSPKRKTYAAHYPDGYELIDYIDATDEQLHADPIFMEAHRLNVEQG